MSLEMRIVELETRQAFQDDTIQALNDEVVEQNRVIERLQLQVAELIRRHEEMVGQYADGGRSLHRPITECGGVAWSAARDRDHVFGLQALVAVHHRELHALAFDQHAVALAADGAKVHEDVIAGVAGDESKAFRRVEPFHGAGITLAGLQRSALAASLARAAGETGSQMQGSGEHSAGQCRQIAKLRAGQQGDGLQDNRQHQHETGSQLQLLAHAFVVQRQCRGEDQVEQAEQCQVHGFRLLQEGCRIGSEAGYER